MIAPPRPIPLAIAPIRWGVEFGWIAIYDREMRRWHEVPRDAAPRWWAQAAQEAKQAAQAGRQEEQ